MLLKEIVKLCQREKLKWFYSAKTHYKLNNWTLQINDREIAEIYHSERLARMDRGYPYIQAITIVYFIFRLYQ